MELDDTRTVNFAPELGEVTPFERLCMESTMLTIAALPDGIMIRLTGTPYSVEQPLTTDDGTAIPFDTALQLAARFLLARLEAK